MANKITLTTAGRGDHNQPDERWFWCGKCLDESVRYWREPSASIDSIRWIIIEL